MKLDKKYYIAPSLLSCNFLRLEEEIHKITAAGADILHLDVMDGHFVPNLTIGQPVIEKIRGITEVPLDVHLMVTNAEDYIDFLVDVGVEMVSVHVETVKHLHRTVDRIRAGGALAGVVLNPATSIHALDEIVRHVDFVLAMTVNPGFGGQKFIGGSLGKLKKINQKIAEEAPGVRLEVDGGVSEKNIKELSLAGVSIFVAGSAIFEKEDYKKTMDAMRKEIVI